MASKDNKSLNANWYEPARTAKSSLVLCGLLLIILLSCRSAPDAPPEGVLEQPQFVPLNSGASVYIFADVKRARPIIELLPIEELKERQAAQMLDRTDFAVVALFPPESGQRFQLSAWGDYPNTQANWAFAFNRNWQKKRSSAGGSFWHSSANRLSMIIEKKRAFAAASLTTEPLEPVTSGPGVKIPEGFNEFRQGNSGLGSSPLSCWLTDPSLIFSRMFVGLPIRFPVQELFLNLDIQEENQYEAEIRFQFENASHARGMAAILNLAGAFAPADSLAGLFLANPPVQNERNLDIKTAVLGESEISLLLQMFLLY